MLVEHARNICGIPDATHAEYGAGGTEVISLLGCSLQGQTISVALARGSRLATLYGALQTVESTTCSYGLAPALQHIAGEHGMRAVGVDGTGEVRAVERMDHPFFLATLYQPQLRSEPNRPHPIFVGLLRAVGAAAT